MGFDFDTAQLTTRSRSQIVVDMMAALHKLDALAREMERKWGACRLPSLVPDELSKRFYSQHRKLAMALREGRDQDALHEIDRMVNAWRYLDGEADRLGAEPIHPGVWEVALGDGTVAAIVKDEDVAAAVDPQDRSVRVYLLSEIARLIDAVPTVIAIKDEWPGAKVVPTRTITADSWWWENGDELPF
ncbi:hypothetical protein [Pararhizobium haloflavum]|uniref:hypothetical protein n=1 Tax=Pararhizobium haloflavum TaxID=2037914 RepID=UPI000C17D10A|nr:hypothetical protein [Pararhizobium haloflavum]